MANTQIDDSLRASASRLGNLASGLHLSNHATAVQAGI